jgi:hypothetical protein
MNRSPRNRRRVSPRWAPHVKHGPNPPRARLVSGNKSPLRAPCHESAKIRPTPNGSRPTRNAKPGAVGYVWKSLSTRKQRNGSGKKLASREGLSGRSSQTSSTGKSSCAGAPPKPQRASRFFTRQTQTGDAHAGAAQRGGRVNQGDRSRCLAARRPEPIGVKRRLPALTSRPSRDRLRREWSAKRPVNRRCCPTNGGRGCRNAGGP